MYGGGEPTVVCTTFVLLRDKQKKKTKKKDSILTILRAQQPQIEATIGKLTNFKVLIIENGKIQMCANIKANTKTFKKGVMQRAQIHKPTKVAQLSNTLFIKTPLIFFINLHFYFTTFIVNLSEQLMGLAMIYLKHP